MLSASKLWKSSSISGPAATSNPARRKSVSMRRRALVTGCSPPASSPRPGRVTSRRPAASSRSMATRSSCKRRASSAACTSTFAWLMRAPAAGRSLADSAPRAFSCSVSVPFLPSQRTRTSSSAASSLHAAISASARPVRAVRSDKTRPFRGSGDTESGLGLLGDRAKRRHVVHGEVGEHLAVDLDSGLVQAVDDAAVGKAIGPCCRIDARDPQRAEFALVRPPVAVGVLARLDDSLLGRTVDLAPGVVVALRLGKNLLVTTSRRHATLDSCHGVLRLLVIGKKLLETTYVGLIDEARAAGAGMTLHLAGLVTEVMATIGRVALEALRCFAKALGRGPVGLQLGHRQLLLLYSPVRKVQVHPLAGERPAFTALRRKDWSATSFSVQ